MNHQVFFFWHGLNKLNVSLVCTLKQNVTFLTNVLGCKNKKHYVNRAKNVDGKFPGWDSLKKGGLLSTEKMHNIRPKV